MYAHNVSRDDYQDLGREMLGLDSIVQQAGKGPRLPGLDVLIGCGWGTTARASDLQKQGVNATAGNPFITDEDRQAIDVANGGRYVVASRNAGQDGKQALSAAATQAAQGNHRLFGLFGLPVSNHLPYSTTNGDFVPSRGIRGVAERYTPADLQENPSLADMTRAALQVLSTPQGKPFALFVEAGDVDFALHDNNLDNAIGAIYDGEKAFQAIVDWVRAHSNWDESVVLATADHGHYLVVDDPEALAGQAKPR
jgi:alkaline phosphatase